MWLNPMIRGFDLYLTLYLRMYIYGFKLNGCLEVWIKQGDDLEC